MTLRTIIKPASALASKEYALHVESNLMVMKDPTYDDIKACKGVLIETTVGWEWFVGRAYLDMMAGISKRLGREPTFLELKSELSKLRHYGGTSSNIKSSADATLGIFRASTGFGAEEVQKTYAAIYAVPHRAFAGRGASNLCCEMALLTNENGNLGPGQYGTMYGPSGMTCGPAAPTGTGYGVFEPVGWMLGAAASQFTYSQFIDKVVEGMEDKDGIRAKVKLGVTGFLTKLGISLSSKVLLPFFVTSDGRMTPDFAMASPKIGVRSGVYIGGGAGGDKVVPFLGGRLCFGAGDYESFPVVRGNNINNPNQGVWMGYSRSTGTSGSLDQVTSPLKLKVGALETIGLVGCQPFGAFFSLNNTGAYSPKLIDETTMTDTDWLSWAKFGFDADSVKTTADAETPEQTYQQQGTALVNTLTSTGGREERTGFTAADTWLITPRQLLRLCWDPISIEGNNGVWVESKAHMVLATPMADGTTSTALVTV